MERNNQSTNRPQSVVSSIKRKPRKRSFRALGIGASLLVVVAGLGFVGGMQYQKSQDEDKSSNSKAESQEQVQKLHTGQVVALDDSSVTIKDKQGKSGKFFIDENTKIRNRTVEIGISDIKIDDAVTIYADSVKKETAVMIVVKPPAAPVGNAPTSISPSSSQSN